MLNNTKIGLLVAVVLITIGVVIFISCTNKNQDKEAKPQIKEEGESVVAQEKSEGEAQVKGVLIEFGGSSFVRAPHTEAQLYVTVAHSCEDQDELILEKVEIYGEEGKVVKSFDINRRLEAIGVEIKEMDTLKQELGITDEQTEYPSSPKALEMVSLSERIRGKSFQSGYFLVDLRKIKEPLAMGDKAPVTARVTAVHNGETVLLTRVVIVEYKR